MIKSCFLPTKWFKIFTTRLFSVWKPIYAHWRLVNFRFFSAKALVALLMILFSFALPSLAAKKPETLVIADLKPIKPLSKSQAYAITERVRDVVINSGIFQVLSREEMENIRREARFQMSDECKKGEDEISCYIDMGGAAGAKKMITGSLSLLGETYSLTLKLVDLKTTSPINSVFKQKKCKPDQLFQLALEATQELLGLPPTQIRDGIKIVQENLSSKRADKNVSLSKTGVKTNFKGNLKVCTRQSKVGRSSKGGWEKFCIPHLSCPPGSQVVTDKNSGLVWMKKSLVPKKEAGKTDQKVSTVTKPYYLPQQQAAKLCHSFGSDWRLPQVDELESLLLFANQVSKAKLAACFPNLKGNFWTATHSMHFSANKYIVDQATLWQVDFVYGLVNPLHKKNSAYVLCVKREATVLK